MKHHHKSYDKSQNSVLVPGWRLKLLLIDEGCQVGDSEDDRDYGVCNTITRSVRALGILRRQRKPYKQKAPPPMMPLRKSKRLHGGSMLDVEKISNFFCRLLVKM